MDANWHLKRRETSITIKEPMATGGQMQTNKYICTLSVQFLDYFFLHLEHTLQVLCLSYAKLDLRTFEMFHNYVSTVL